MQLQARIKETQKQKNMLYFNKFICCYLLFYSFQPRPACLHNSMQIQQPKTLDSNISFYSIMTLKELHTTEAINLHVIILILQFKKISWVAVVCGLGLIQSHFKKRIQGFLCFLFVFENGKTCAKGKCLHSCFEFSHIFMSVSIGLWKKGQSIFYFLCHYSKWY